MFLPKSRYPLLILVVLAISLLILSASFRERAFHNTSVFQPENADAPADSVGSGTTGFNHTNIAISSTFGAHHDVYMAVAWTIERVLKSHGTVQVYGGYPFSYGFSSIIEDYGLYHGTFRHPDELVPDILSGLEDKQYDLVILGTCEVRVHKLALQHL